jgi:putative molybdopterin biosynthesis protein
LVEEVSFRGSEESLALFSRGMVELAGFHLEGFDVRRFVQPGRDILVRFAMREQGLIVAHGNPKRLASVADIAKSRARFVNRQRGSGTRRLIERLMADAGIAADSIRGFATEEYTHRAVAATVAAGGADAGFGVQAAAAELGLDFVPVLRERYWLAMRERTVATPAAQQLLVALAGKPFSRIARGFAGYDVAGAGDIVNVEEAFS